MQRNVVSPLDALPRRCPTLGNVCGVVFLQEVLARQQYWVIHPCGQLRLDTVMTPRQSSIVDTPNNLDRVVWVVHRGQVTMLLVCGQLEGSHDLQKGAAPVVAEQQRNIAGDFGRGTSRLTPMYRVKRDEHPGQPQRLKPCLAKAGMGKWFHHRGPSKGFHGHDRVQQGQRPNPSRVGGATSNPMGPPMSRTSR
jgi:hypothetical protein